MTESDSAGNADLTWSIIGWVKNKHNCDIYECPVCHHEAYWDADYGQQLFDFCPHCGQKLREPGTYRIT